MKYYQALNTGHGFITNEDRASFSIEGKPCDIWVVEDNLASSQWAGRNNAVATTQEAAEALWSALPPAPEMPL